MTMMKILPNIPVIDWWPLEKVPEVTAAYKMAEQQGEIKLTGGCVYKSSGGATISYLSIAPEEWIHEKLKQYKDEIEKGANG